MHIEHLTAQHTISLHVDTCLATLTQDVAEPVQSLYADLAAQGIKPNAPLVFVYRDLDGDIDRPFSLEVAQPVDEATCAQYRGRHKPGTLKPMTCAQQIHTGGLSDMGERTYAPLFADIASSGLKAGRECREVYTVFDGLDHADNETRVMVEVQPA